MIEIRIVDAAHKQDVKLPNDPFPIWGRMIPSFTNETWGYTTESFPSEQVTEMCFPEEDYDFDAMSPQTTFLAAYDGKVCVGLILLEKGFFRYFHVPDLKVSKAYRGRGVGSLLVQHAAQYAKDHNCRGLYLEGQDNNLSACLFYIKAGFRIGGLNTELYKGTSQEGKSDILFYLDA